MKKSDALISFIIGFFIGVFFFVGLKIIEIEIPCSWLLIIIFPPLALFGMFIASVLGKKFLFILQAARFLLVGALNTFIDLGVLNFLMWVFGIAAGVSYSVFKAISFLAATVNSYFWNKYWTFEKKERKPGPKEFIKFLIITTIGFLINVGIASFVVNITGPKFGITEVTWGNIGAFAAVFVAWIWNFIGSKFIVFR